MPEQILLQGKLLGIDDFLATQRHSADVTSEPETVAARSLWVSLVCEVLPRALLAELDLARVLLGSSGGGQFLLVLPDTSRDASITFLSRAVAQIDKATQGTVRLIWASTENLGGWTVVRKRLNESLAAAENAPLAAAPNFEPYTASIDVGLFTPELAHALRTTEKIGWSPDLPSIITTDEAKHQWALGPNLSLEGILLTREAAPGSYGSAATPADFLQRAHGQPFWGVLRGNVDHFAIRLRRVNSIEEHVQISVLYKQFFAGELNVPNRPDEFRGKFSILYSGGNDFAVYGSWDALIEFARELHGTFQRFAEENLREYPGAEAKTITMALALSEDPHEPLAALFEQAGRNLAIAKAEDKDCIYLLDRILEWKQLEDAADLKDSISRVSEEFKAGRQFLEHLSRLYRKVSTLAESAADHDKLLARAYRFQRRYSRAAGSKREREFQKLRTHLINEIVGRNVRPAPGKQLRLRPAGVVALEWARLLKRNQAASAR
jgi:CRISPR-associated protein Csm1